MPSPLTYLFFLVLGLARGLAAQSPGAELYRDDFSGDLSQWVVEQQPGGTVRIRDGALEIDDAAGCTGWFRTELTAQVVITCELTFVTSGGPNDRWSDLNGFWIASGLVRCGPRPQRALRHVRSAAHLLRGPRGNTPKTTRFRRSDGTGARPLPPEMSARERKTC